MDPTPTDLEILAGLRAGDRVAQRVFFERYDRRLQRLCRRKLGLSREDAEEVAADTLRVVLLEPTRFDPERGVALGAWLCCIAHNRAIDLLRASKHRLRETHLSPLLPAPPEEPAAPGPMHGVAEAVARLTEQRKPALHRVLGLHMRGYTHGEVGRMVGRNEAAVRQQVCRGKRWIERVVEDGALGEEATALLRRRLARGGGNGNGGGAR